METEDGKTKRIRASFALVLSADDTLEKLLDDRQAAYEAAHNTEEADEDEEVDGEEE